jgi:hypothetical protein
VLAKRGMKDALCIGMNDGGGAGPHPDTNVPYNDIQAAWPAVRYYRVCHMWNLTQHEDGPNRPKWGSVALVGGVLGVFSDIDQEQPYYGWRSPQLMLVYPRTDNMDFAGARLAQNSRLPEHRLAAEGSMLTGRRSPGGTARGNIAGQVGRSFTGLRGFGPLGADFWPVLAGPKESKTIIGRYGDGYNEGGWGTVSFNNVMQSVLAPGKDAYAVIKASSIMVAVD